MSLPKEGRKRLIKTSGENRQPRATRLHIPLLPSAGVKRAHLEGPDGVGLILLADQVQVHVAVVPDERGVAVDGVDDRHEQDADNVLLDPENTADKRQAHAFSFTAASLFRGLLPQGTETFAQGECLRTGAGSSS